MYNFTREEVPIRFRRQTSGYHKQQSFGGLIDQLGGPTLHYGRMPTMDKIHIVLDNLRVGGIQRLALDEAYSLSRFGKTVFVLIMEEPYPIDDLREIDNEFFRQHNIQVLFLPKNRRSQIRWAKNYLNKHRPKTILCHSAKSIWIFRIAAILSMKKIFLVCFLHQLITLSSNVQKTKRFLLFCLANQVRASSQQFILEFEYTFRKVSLISRLVMRKLIFDRMGIDTFRIKENQASPELIHITGKPALIFNSRLTGWKGFESFLNLAEFLGSKFQYILITSRIGHQSSLLSRYDSLPTSKSFYGKSVSNFFWDTPSIHLYPTNYGAKVKYPQNIGLNVLECLALGIPSIISIEGYETWPEFKGLNLIHMTSWRIDEVNEIIQNILAGFGPKPLPADPSLLDTIGINNHLNRIQEVIS